MDCYLQNYTAECSPHTCQSLAAQPWAGPRAELESCCGSRWLVGLESGVRETSASAFCWVGSKSQDHLPALLKGAPGQCDGEEEGQAQCLARGPGPAPPSIVCVGKGSCLQSGRGGGWTGTHGGEATRLRPLNGSQETTLPPGDGVGFLPQFLLRIASSIQGSASL